MLTLGPPVCVVAALTLAAATAPAAPAPTTLEPPRYDAGSRALRLRYHGPAPRWTQGTLTGPHRVFLDFDARCGVASILTEGVRRHPTLIGWAMAPREGTHTRITLLFRAGTGVQVRVDEAARLVWLLPQPATPARVGPSEEPVPTFPTSAPVRRAAAPSPPTSLPPSFGPAPHLALPHIGTTPSATPSVDINDVLAGLEALNRPLPVPSEGTTYLPGSPDAPETPGPTLLSAPSTAPFPAPPVVLSPSTSPQGPGHDLHAATAGMLGAFEELGEGSSARAESASILGLRLHGRWATGGRLPAGADGWLPWWSTQLDAYAGSLAYLDPAIANGLHARQTWRAHLSLLRGVRLSPLELQGGVGLLARHQLDWRAVVPVAGTSIGAGSRTLLAPELIVLGRLPLTLGFELYGEGALAPVVYVLDGAVTKDAAPTTGSRLEGGLGWRWEGLRVALGYRRWSLGGLGFSETVSGPVVTLGGWLNPTSPREPGGDEPDAPRAD